MPEVSYLTDVLTLFNSSSETKSVLLMIIRSANATCLCIKKKKREKDITNKQVFYLWGKNIISPMAPKDNMNIVQKGKQAIINLEHHDQWLKRYWLFLNIFCALIDQIKAC